MPNVNIDFSEVGGPTAKQIDFVQEIYRALKHTEHIEMPPYTFEAYSEFINEWRDVYYDTVSQQDTDYD